jgi:hypothetical protein
VGVLMHGYRLAAQPSKLLFTHLRPYATSRFLPFVSALKSRRFLRCYFSVLFLHLLSSLLCFALLPSRESLSNIVTPVSR